MSETLAEQARRKGFTSPTHRLGSDLYPIVVRPDPGLPQGWIVLDEWISTSSAHMKELGEAVNEYAAAKISPTATRAASCPGARPPQRGLRHE